jgi:DNA-binding MarR family transcriptional regulator
MDHRSEDRMQAESRVIEELRALSTALDRLDQFAAERLGLNRTDLRALDLIGQGGTVSPSSLARSLGMSTGATTVVLDRLERAGYAVRSRDSADRRRILVRMTPLAEELSQAIFGPVMRGVRAQASEFSSASLAAIAGFLRKHSTALNAYADSTDTGGAGTGQPA